MEDILNVIMTKNPIDVRMNKSKYKEYLESYHWQHTRLMYFRLRRENRCELCGATETELHVHHLSYDRIYREAYADLCMLCSKCHKMVHNQEKKVIRYEPYWKYIYNSLMFEYYKAFGSDEELASETATCWMSDYNIGFGTVVGELKERAKFFNNHKNDLILLKWKYCPNDRYLKDIYDFINELSIESNIKNKEIIK